jgi:tetratricopeptide (TPR) repeat protein
MAHDFMTFDDEPLERILYGEPVPGPTPANLFAAGIDFTRKLAAAHENKDIPKIAAAAVEFAKHRYPLSLGCCFDLTAILEKIVPSYPRPVLEFDLAPFGSLLEQIWELAVQATDESLQDAAGTLLYRWYEHHGRYDDARRILTILMEIQRDKGDSANEAVYLNNYAYEFLLEERWDEAAPLFEKAAALFMQSWKTIEHANARTNYWTCLIEGGRIIHFKRAEKELKWHSKMLGRRGNWHSRKPFILLAKINERRGDIEKAIKLVETAIQASLRSRTRYTELDVKYLARLKLMRENQI